MAENDPTPIGRETFKKINPSDDSHFDEKDAKKVEAVWSLLKPAMQARRPAVENARKLLGICNDHFVDVMEENAPIDRETNSWDQQGSSQKRTYYTCNVVQALAGIRQANYASVPTEFVAQRLTLCEADRITAEVSAGLVNRYYSPQLERNKRAHSTSVATQGHTLLHIVWDPTLGPSRRPRKAVETTEETSEYAAKGPTGRRTEKVTIQNKLLRTETRPKQGVVASALRAMGRDETEEVKVYQKMDQWGNLLFNDIPTGLPRVDVVGPVDYVVDPLAREGGMADARFAAVVKRVDAAYLYEQFGDESKYPGAMAKLAAWEKWSKRIDANPADRFVRQKQGAPNDSAGEQSATLTIFYLLPASQLGLPHGLYAIIVSENSPESDDASGDAMVLYWDELAPPHLIPLIDGAVEIAAASSFYGMTYMQKGAPLNHQLNRVYGYIDEAAALASQRWNTGPRGTPQNVYRAESVAGAAGAIVLQLPDGVAPDATIKELPFDGSQMFQMTFVKDIIHMLEDLSHTHGPQANQGSDLAVEVMANLQRDESVAGQVKQDIAGQYSRGGHYFLRLLQIYATVDDLQRLLPDYTMEDIKVFKNADLGEFSTILRLKQTTMLSNNPALQNEYMKSFAQMGDRIWEVVTPDELASIFLSHTTLGETASARQEELAERENSRMRIPVKWEKPPDAEGKGGVMAEGSGPDPVSMVAPSDDDKAHLRKHHNPTGDPRRDLLPVDYLVRIDTHCARHEQQMMEKAIKAAKLAALMQATAQAALVETGNAPPEQEQSQGGAPSPR